MVPEVIKPREKREPPKAAVVMLERTKERMHIAIFGLEHGQLSIANRWSYDAILGCIKACLLCEGKNASHRDELFQMFKTDFLRSGIFPSDLEPKIAYALDLHLGIEEEDYYLLTIEQMHTAMDLLRLSEEYLNYK